MEPQKAANFTADSESILIDMEREEKEMGVIFEEFFAVQEMKKKVIEELAHTIAKANGREMEEGSELLKEIQSCLDMGTQHRQKLLEAQKILQKHSQIIRDEASKMSQILKEIEASTDPSPSVGVNAHLSCKTPNSGLVNLGKTCYINSAIQCLYSMPGFRKYILEDMECNVSYNRTQTRIKKGAIDITVIAKSLKTVFSEMATKDSPVSPREFKNQFALLFPEFGSNLLSQDVSECLLKLLNSLDSELHRKMRKKKRSCTMELERWESYRKDNDTIVTDQITYMTGATICCQKCKTPVSAATYDINKILMVPESMRTLKDGLEVILGNAELVNNGKNNQFCEKCFDFTPATRETLFSVLPETLIIQLLRFNAAGKKLENNVMFPLVGLNMKPYCLQESNVLYDLVAVTNHYGTDVYDGHYVTYAKQNDGRWVLYNDDKVSFVNKSKICSKDAYLLIYQRRN